jgi:hypothetical protein
VTTATSRWTRWGLVGVDSSSPPTSIPMSLKLGTIVRTVGFPSRKMSAVVREDATRLHGYSTEFLSLLLYSVHVLNCDVLAVYPELVDNMSLFTYLGCIARYNSFPLSSGERNFIFCIVYLLGSFVL